MPIFGKTDSQTLEDKVIDLQVIYRLWKGEAKELMYNDDGSPRLNKSGKQMETAGKDLEDRFRFTGSDRAVEKFQECYGTLYPKEVRIYLPYATVDECFETWMEKYTFGSFQHRCNGQRIVEKKVRKQYKAGQNTKYTWQKEKVDLPCVKLEQGLDVCPECGKNGTGRLFFYVADLYAAGSGSTKCGMLSLGSEHDLAGLSASLHKLQKKYGSLHASPIPSPWTFGFIPYILTRERKEIMKAAGETQQRGETWVVTISEDPVWLECLQRWQQANEINALAGNPEMRRLLAPSLSISRPILAGAIAPVTSPIDHPIEAEVVSLEPEIDNWKAPKIQAIYSQLNRLNLSLESAIDQEFFGDSKPERLEDLTDSQLDNFLQWLKQRSPQKAEQNQSGDREPIMKEINEFLAVLGWDTSKARQYLKDNFNGKNTRQKLTDEELIDLRDRLDVLVQEVKAATTA